MPLFWAQSLKLQLELKIWFTIQRIKMLTDHTWQCGKYKNLAIRKQNAHMDPRR